MTARTRPGRTLIRRDVVSYARRDGRYSQRNAAAWTPALAHLLLAPPRGPRATSIDPDWRCDPLEAFGRAAPLVVEIGIGNGDAVLAHAAAHPQLNHLAVEVYRPGLARTVVQASARGLSNLRVLEGDGRTLLTRSLPPAGVHEVHVWFPDPWPKARHHKRRLVDEAFAAAVARVLEPGGVLRLATDWDDYAARIEQVLTGAVADQILEPLPAGHDPAAAVRQRGRYPWRPVTRFEAKGAASGRSITDFAVRRPAR